MPEAWTDQRTPALAIVARGDQILQHGDEFVVKSQSNPKQCYCVNPEGQCDCTHHQNVGRDCIHILATRYYLEVQQDHADGTTTTERVPLTRKTAWSAYNKAQATEGHHFDKLLEDLVQAIEEPPYQGMGRPPLSVRDQAFCAIKKVYSQMSQRRARSLFDQAEDEGRVDHAPHYNAVGKWFNKDDTEEILHELIRLSSLPLAGVESKFAVDSTGLTTTKKGRHCENKHRVSNPGKEQKWLKLHVCTGTRTNIITSARITKSKGKGTGDTTLFEPLVIETAEGFKIGEVSADKAYSSRKNHNITEDAGGIPYIPFKKNAGGRAMSSPMWKRMFHQFQLREEEFNKHYHARSNVESTIGALKQKFGETLKSRNHQAQVNEALAKIVAYNITVLIHQVHLLGIDPELGTPAPKVGEQA